MVAGGARAAADDGHSHSNAAAATTGDPFPAAAAAAADHEGSDVARGTPVNSPTLHFFPYAVTDAAHVNGMHGCTEHVRA